jgi:DNA invertase Pin-like site-specific DNA recombinase
MPAQRDTTTRVAIYTRVSTLGTGQDTENQAIQLREYCHRQGWTIVQEYVDRVTGKHSDREQFQRLFQDAAQRHWDVVLFWSLDRFSREGVRETLNHLERLTSYGVGWRSFTEQYLDSCGIFKDAVLSILATVAKQERVRLSERTRAGLERARRSGRVPGRPKRVFRRDDVVRLRDVEHMSWRAIAAALGIPVTTAVDAYRAENVSLSVASGDGNDSTSVVRSDLCAIDR